MPTLLIADDHPLFRAALRQAAADAVDALQVREADSLDSVLAALDAEPGIDLVLLDLQFSDSCCIRYTFHCLFFVLCCNTAINCRHRELSTLVIDS